MATTGSSDVSNPCTSVLHDEREDILLWRHSSGDWAVSTFALFFWKLWSKEEVAGDMAGDWRGSINFLGVGVVAFADFASFAPVGVLSPAFLNPMNAEILLLVLRQGDLGFSMVP